MNVTAEKSREHPLPELLRCFAAGLIDDGSVMDTVELHVLDCAVCAKYLSGLTPGTIQATVTRWAANGTAKGAAADLDENRRFELIEEIGRGGSGIVYKARQVGLERLLAWKVLISGSRASPAELARFRREAQALAQLDHPQIVRVHDFGEQDGAPFLALEFVDGPTLAKRLERGPVNPRIAAGWIRDLGRAIDCAHQRSIFHRDLKPQNVLLAVSDAAADDSQFTPKIADFGLARFEDGSLFHTQTGETLGTPAYLAPEMIGTKHGESGNAAVDVYGLGTILYECLTGRPPFIGSSHLEILTAVAQREPPSVRILRHSVPRDLAVICHRCLAKNPAQRFASAAELADDLDRFLQGKPIASRPVSGMERSIRWCRRNPWKATAAAVLSLSVIAIPAACIYHNVKLHQEKQTAQARYESTRATLWQMLNHLNTDQAASIPQLADLSAKQTGQALALFEELSRADPTERSRLDLAKAEIQAGTLAIVLGKNEQAETHLQQAIGICRELQQSPLIRADAMQELASALNKMGTNLLQSEDPSLAIDCLEQALSIHRQLASGEPAHLGRRCNVAWSLMNLGSVFQVQSSFDQAIPLYEEAVRIWESMAGTPLDNAENRQAIAGSRINLASIHLAQGALDKADANFQQALQSLEQLHASAPDHKSVVEDLTAGLLNYSNCLSGQGRMDDAVIACVRARELLLEALKQEPNRAQLRNNLFLVTANRAHLLGVQDKLPEAAAVWRDSQEIAPDPAMKTYCLQMRLLCLAKIDDVETAVMEAASIDESVLAPNELFLQALVWAHLAKAQLRLANQPNREEALPQAISQDATGNAWRLLVGLRDAGELQDQEQRDSLQTQDDWSAVRTLHSAPEWEGLLRAPSVR